MIPDKRLRHSTDVDMPTSGDGVLCLVSCSMRSLTMELLGLLGEWIACLDASFLHGLHGLHSSHSFHGLHRFHCRLFLHDLHGLHSSHGLHGLHRFHCCLLLHDLHGLHGRCRLSCSLHGLHGLHRCHCLHGLHCFHCLGHCEDQKKNLM